MCIFFFTQKMAQYHFYSTSKEPVQTSRPIDCPMPDVYIPTILQPTHNHKNAVTPPIDYTRFINRFSSKRQPSKLRELSNYDT